MHHCKGERGIDGYVLIVVVITMGGGSVGVLIVVVVVDLMKRWRRELLDYLKMSSRPVWGASPSTFLCFCATTWMCSFSLTLAS